MNLKKSLYVVIPLIFAGLTYVAIITLTGAAWNLFELNIGFRIAVYAIIAMSVNIGIAIADFINE